MKKILASVGVLCLVVTAIFGFYYFDYSKYPDAQSKNIAQEVVNAINDPAIGVWFDGHSFVLEGPTFSVDNKQRDEAIAKAYLMALHIHGLWHKPQILSLIRIEEPTRKAASID